MSCSLGLSLGLSPLRAARLLPSLVYKPSDLRKCSTAAAATAAAGAAAAGGAAAAVAPAAAAKPSVLLANSTDIAFNLATEAFLRETWEETRRDRGSARGLPSGGPSRAPSTAGSGGGGLQGPLLFLWRNEKTVVIGRHQNAWKECDISWLQSENVKLARRYSGGGAVYQDMGNTCFSLLSSQLRKRECSQIILSALREGFGIEAEESGRNDLVTQDGRKFSGWAFVRSPYGWLIHGTLMREVDCAALSRVLTPNQEKLKSKGVASVESRVVNLKELNPTITHENLCEALRRSFLNHLKLPEDSVPFSSAEGFLVDGRPVATHPGFSKHVQKLNDWDWVYGKSPQFSSSFQTRFDWGSVEVGVVVEEGTIKECRVFSDALLVDLIQAFQDTLTGATYTAAVMHSKLAALRPHFTGHAEKIDEFAEWLAGASQF